LSGTAAVVATSLSADRLEADEERVDPRDGGVDGTSCVFRGPAASVVVSEQDTRFHKEIDMSGEAFRFPGPENPARSEPTTEPTSCCGAKEQTSCCDSADKATCCGSAATAGGGCSCR
jgi:hypothetical protein